MRSGPLPFADGRSACKLSTFARLPGAMLLGLFLVSGCDSMGPGPAGNPLPNQTRADASATPTNVPADNATTTVVRLDGTRSVAAQDSTITSYTWISEGRVIAQGAAVEVDLAPGQYQILLQVEDAQGGLATDAVQVSVVASATDTVELTIGASGGGTTLPNPGVHRFQPGEDVVIQAVPDEGFRLLRWSGDAEGNSPTLVVRMDRNLFITAEFAEAGADELPRFFLPWAAGVSRIISQGNNGTFSHQGTYAWDFPMPIGTPVLAAAAGRVVETRESSLRNAVGATEFTQPANMVRIDHGLGMQSMYAHLDFQGVVVEPGQFVSRGQVIGYSCDTGFSTAPHLHFEIVNVTGDSVPAAFFEVEGSGVPSEGEFVTSNNQLDNDSVDAYFQSTTQLDAFAVNGIELDRPLPAVFYNTEQSYSVQGQVLNGTSRVCAALVEPENFETVFCELQDVNKDGTFAFEFEFPPSLTGPHFFGLITGDGGAEGITPLEILIADPIDQEVRPVVITEETASDFIDFGQTHPLRVEQGTSPRGTMLRYFWTQASGPPAEIGDDTSTDTSFALEFGSGSTNVSFQVTAFDGVNFSRPAEVTYTMEDTFFLADFGISSVMCQSPAECPVFEVPPTLIFFSTGLILGWVDAINANVSDVFTLQVITPDGEVLASTDTLVTSTVGHRSFWRMAASTSGFEFIPGDWIARILRNGEEIAREPFAAIPGS